MTIDSMIEVLNAHRNGKKIQLISKTHPNRWTDCALAINGGPLWDFTDYDYRIKPEPKRPREFWLVNHLENGATSACKTCGPFKSKEEANRAEGNEIILTLAERGVEGIED